MIGIGKSDVGKMRTVNEDFIFVSNEHLGSLPNLYCLADGMGGHNAGDVASLNAVRFFCDYIIENQSAEPLDLMISATKYANESVLKMSAESPGLDGMGTTFLAAVNLDGVLYIAHVGDCRLYLIRDNQIMQITTDHTYVMEMVKAGEITLNEARNHPSRNIITRALGTSHDLLVDGLLLNLKDNDLCLMCSDGLTTMVSDHDIQKVLNEDWELSVKLDRLIDMANENGGIDNVSAILIK